MKKDVAPQQEEGASTDIRKSIRLSSIPEAKNHFEIVKRRLLDVSGWNKICKASPGVFQLTTPAGKEVSRSAREGDFFKITIPAPGPDAGNGYDWVKIHSIKGESNENTDSEFLSITVKPARDPTAGKAGAAHFFSSKASSTFVVSRSGRTISAAVHGRNESPNVKDTDFFDTIRNTLVAIGAILGLSEIQWKALVKGLISKKQGKT